MWYLQKTLFIISLFTMLFSCGNAKNSREPSKLIEQIPTDSLDVAILAGGCFWCIEAPLSLADGVDSVISGYIGGTTPSPTYSQVSTGSTGYAEAVKITYNPSKISYDELLEMFFQLHDPTQLNRQGNDIGTQYRSSIFPINNEQKSKAEYYINQLNKTKAYDRPIVTTIEEATTFYPAEDYHQEYYQKNPSEMYCRMVVKPKMDKFKKVFSDKLKK